MNTEACQVYPAKTLGKQNAFAVSIRDICLWSMPLLYMQTAIDVIIEVVF